VAKTVIALLIALVAAEQSQNRPAPTQTEIAPGVIVFSTAPYGDVGLDGNSIAILSNDGVLVFDTNGTPAAASAVLSQIRARTDRPVRFVVNSHWHWDHWYGTEVYANAFPGLHVITHEKTRAMMMGPAIEFNRPGLERDLPRYLTSLEQRAANDASLQPKLQEGRFFLDQKKNAHLVQADVTFSERLTIHMGGHEIQILNFGRGVTPGDTMLYLPNDKILLTGDVIVNPITFALSCFPSEWIAVLQKIDALDVKVIVTGHGAPLHDKTLLHATLDVFRTLLRAGREAKQRGLTADQAKEDILPTLREQMVRITNDDPRLNANFKTQMVDWFLHRVYDEADGPLTDAISSIPRS
jgi:cyclase